MGKNVFLDNDILWSIILFKWNGSIFKYKKMVWFLVIRYFM